MAASVALLLGSCQARHPARIRPVQALAGEASLPLSGDWGPFGRAFRTGFEEGLTSLPDTTRRWAWSWHDNGGDPLATRQWLDSVSRSRSRPHLLLAGLGPAAAELDGTRPVAPCLWLGDGSPAPDSAYWSVWTPRSRMRRLLGARLESLPGPRAAVLVADGTWSWAFLGSRALPVDLAIPHDYENRRWDVEIGQILALRPRVLVLWDHPRESDDLLFRPLLRQGLDSTLLVLQPGARRPAGLRALRLSPAWQPSLPADSGQTDSWRSWGRTVGRSVAEASRGGIPDPASREAWFERFASLPCDSSRLDLPGAWAPLSRWVEETDTVR